MLSIGLEHNNEPLFVSEIDCSYAAVLGLTAATAVKHADFFTSMRCKLLILIKNWEASGQSDGGVDRVYDKYGGENEQHNLDENGDLMNLGRQQDGDKERDEIAEESDVDKEEIEKGKNSVSSSTSPTFGSLKQRPARALDTCAAFLRGMPSYTLYYCWEVAVGSNITSRSGGSNRSGRCGTRRQNSDEETDDDDEMTKNATKSQLLQSLQDLVDSQRSLLLDRALDRERHESENLGSDMSIVIPFG